jgi:hypothetical protein
MSDPEKIEAFDALALALTNRWHDGQWSWWCRTPPGGPSRATREEAVADLVVWAKLRAKKDGGKHPLGMA